MRETVDGVHSLLEKSDIIGSKEQRRLLERLVESGQEYLGVFDLVPHGVCVLVDRSIVHCNRAGRAVFGAADPDVVTGRSIIDIVDVAERRRIAEWLKKALDLGVQLPPAEFSFVRSDGGSAAIEARALSFSMRGRGAIMMVFRDVSDERRNRRALRESEERFRDISCSIGDVIWEVDPDWCYTYASGRVEELLECRSEEIVGRSFFEFMPEDERLRVQALCMGASARRVPLVDVERLMRTGSGKKIYVQTNAVPVEAPDGTVGGYRGVDRDVTDRRLARDVIRDSGEKYRAVLEAISDPLYISSAGLRVSYLNPAMIARVGANAVGSACHEAIHGLPERCPWCVSGEALAGRCARFEVASPLDNRIYVVSHSPIRHTDGSVSTIHILADITERRLAGGDGRGAGRR